MNSRILMAILAGAAIGAFAGVLLAPSKGSELRRDIAERAKDILDVILAKAEEIVDEAEDISSGTRTTV
jgi:gas vesicle protein